MKQIKELTIVEEEKQDYSKFDALVRAGLANKAQLQRMHKILDRMSEEKPNFSQADCVIIQNIFNKMVNLITTNPQMFNQARRAVREDIEAVIVEASDFKDPPPVLLLKRKAIRMYDNNAKIALYYNDKLDKYFSIPFGSKLDMPVQAESVVMNFADGTSIELTEEQRAVINYAYEQLDEENKNKFLEVLTQSKPSFEKTYEFCKQYN
jgi:hypothetical protein